MGGERRCQVAERFEPRFDQVGEAVWDPFTVCMSSVSRRDTALASSRQKKRCSVGLELLRRKGMKRLQARIETALVALLGRSVCGRLELKSEVTLRNGNGLYERWLLHRQLSMQLQVADAQSGSRPDPTDALLPRGYSHESEAPLLLRELKDAGVDESTAAEAARALGGEAASTLRWLRQQTPPSHPNVTRRATTGTPSRVSSTGARGDGERIEFVCGKVGTTVGSVHLAKLHELYQRTLQQRVPVDDADFVEALFCLLLRYETLEGFGFQSSLTGRVFDALRDMLGISMECFASPLNCRFGRFCSAFPDVDVPFGSLGSFFEVFADEPSAVSEGSFEANPPFLPPLIGAMAHLIDKAIKRAQSRGLPLSFAVIIPVNRDVNRTLEASPFLRRTLVAVHRQHTYNEGRQHAHVAGRERASTCDTAIFFLQSDAAVGKWPVTDESCSVLLSAMASGSVAAATAATVPQKPSAADKQAGAPEAAETVGARTKSALGASSSRHGGLHSMAGVAKGGTWPRDAACVRRKVAGIFLCGVASTPSRARYSSVRCALRRIDRFGLLPTRSALSRVMGI